MVNPLKVLTLGMFSDPDTIKSLDSGRSWLSLSDLGSLSDALAVPVLPTLMQIFVRPNYYVPDWLPVLPFDIVNPVDPSAWVGSEGTHPQDPRDDPFYHPEISKYQDLKNGDVIDLREVGLSAFWVNIKKSYQISYRTESTFGWPQADVTTIMIPNNPNGQVVSYQMWQDSTSLQCCPSYSVVTGISDPTMDILLLLGYTVNFPDHQGQNSSFAAGIKEGKSTLDSLRAFLNAREKMELDTNSYNKIVMWGYSGGSIATGHAVEALPTYASELKENVLAGICGGYVANLTSVFAEINGGVFAGFAAAGLWGLGTEYKDVQDVIDNRIRPGIKWRFNYVGKRCILANLVNNMFQNIWSYTDDASGAIIDEPKIQAVIDKETIGLHAYPNVPMLVYNGVQDEIASIVEVDRVVDYYCKNGVKVDYMRYGALGHVFAEFIGLPEGLKYVIKFFDGYVPNSCSDHADATKEPELKLDPSKVDAVIDQKWDESGILDQLRNAGYIH